MSETGTPISLTTLRRVGGDDIIELLNKADQRGIKFVATLLADGSVDLFSPADTVQ